MPKSARTSIPISVRRIVLHEAGFRCANPVCRGIITLDIHHIEYVSQDGRYETENLLPLCPNCHSLHHSGYIPLESIRTWKMLLISLNEGFSRATIDILLSLDEFGPRPILLMNDTVLMMGSLIATGLIYAVSSNRGQIPEWDYSQSRFVALTDKGKAFIAAWKAGNQLEALRAASNAIENELSGSVKIASEIIEDSLPSSPKR
jgi:HNH endonuclease